MRASALSLPSFLLLCVSSYSLRHDYGSWLDNPSTTQVFDGITSELDSKLGAAASIRGGGEGGKVVEEATVPIEGMKPGTSGLRKKVGLGILGS